MIGFSRAAFIQTDHFFGLKRIFRLYTALFDCLRQYSVLKIGARREARQDSTFWWVQSYVFTVRRNSIGTDRRTDGQTNVV